MAIINKPSDYFNTILYTGDDGTRNITEADTFQADLVWLKRRNAISSHYWVDSVRGATKSLSSNADTLEATESAGVTGFVTDGFSLGGAAGYNNTGDTFASWLWKAGTSVSGTTGGSGTSKAYSGSVNTDSGFSIIKYGGNGTAGHTIPHHLGAAPSMVICKSITQNRGWPTQHVGLTSAAYAIYLSFTGAEASNPAGGGTNTWNSTAASSTVVTLGNNANNNRVDSNDQYIMYSFAEKQGFSKFGSYTGNGNADGTFVYLGFKPAFTLFKKTNATSEWFLYDNKRLGYNVTEKVFEANTTSAEDSSSATYIDYLSNGFKLRGTSGNTNASGSTYIYMAFAENPFVTSTTNGSIPATAR